MANKINKWISDFASLFVLPKEDRSSTPNAEQRSIGISDTNGMLKIFNISDSGINVSEETALGITALWCGIDIYCSLSATVPRKLFSKKNGTLKEETKHPSSVLINYMPFDEYVPFDFRYSMRFNSLMRGGGGAEIIRDKNGRPKSLRLMRYGCTPYKLNKDDQLLYYDNEDGKAYFPEDVYFIPGIMVRDGHKAMPLIDVFKNKFGEELTHQLMVNSFMKNAPNLAGVYTTPKNLNDKQLQKISETLDKEFGGAKKSGGVLPLGNAESFTQLKPNSFVDGQVVELANFRIEDIARILRMPVSLLQSLVKPSYNSLEQLFIQWKVTTLDAMFTREDQECNKKLLKVSDLGTLYFETIVDEMMWTTTEKRVEVWWKKYQMGAITTNEIREYDNRNPVKGGDKPMVQVNMTTLEMAQTADPTNKERKKRTEKANPKQTVLFEETITHKKNGRKTNVIEN